MLLFILTVIAPIDEGCATGVTIVIDEYPAPKPELVFRRTPYYGAQRPDLRHSSTP